MKLILSLTLALAAGTFAAQGADILAEPGSSALASGRWVKVRVDADGVYELTDNRLRELGFSDPSKVNVYGYAPTVLLTHDLSLIPVDLEPRQSVYGGGKLLFYAKSNTDYAPELWHTAVKSEFSETSMATPRRRHAQSRGATYFLSDRLATRPAIASVAAPAAAPADLRSAHTAIAVHEEDGYSLSEGGIWLSGPTIDAARTSDSFSLSLDNVAGPEARAVWLSLMGPSATSSYNFLNVTYPDGFTCAEYEAGNSSHGFSASSLGSYVYFNPSMRYQALTVPVKAAGTDYEFTYAVHPQAAAMNRPCALDYFALLYQRTNTVGSSGQTHMYFENVGTDGGFTLANPSGARAWDVTNPSAIVSYELTSAGLGSLRPTADAEHPLEVVAFNPAVSLPEPEIIGAVENQDLHSLSAPDMVIVTSALFADAAREAADVHQSLQGLDVAVVDQQQIFNEYSSGNTSPEAVRRFLRHLSVKQPGKLRAVLMLGPGTIFNAREVKPDAPYVVTYEVEDYGLGTNITRNFCSDNFFGLFENTARTDGNWGTRPLNLRMFGGLPRIAVGRLPFSSAAEVRSYYAKAVEYISNPPRHPAWGNILMSTDYAAKNEASHFANGETMLSSIAVRDRGITVTRASKQYYEGSTSPIPYKMQTASLTDGPMLYAYFGHGTTQALSGNISFQDVMKAEALRTPGRYPVAFFGTCLTGAFDKTQKGLITTLLSNSNGGPVAIVASSREVYQAQNAELGRRFAASLYADENRPATLGEAWCRASSNAIASNLSSSYLYNYLDYNYLGDPMLPLYAPTHELTASLNDGAALKALAPNTLTGTVTDADGNLASGFNGAVTVTVYEVPEVRNNVIADASTNGHKAQFTMDSQVAGRYYGDVKNGQFTVSFTAPAMTAEGNRRVQVYACSADASERALGVLTDVGMTFDADNVATPEGAPVSIDAFTAGSGAPGERMYGPVEITARISAPLGLPAASAVSGSVRVNIDGKPVANAARLLEYAGEGTYTLRVVSGNLSGGRHECTVAAIDAGGNMADASLVFFVDNAPAAILLADISAGSVNFDLQTSMAAVERTLFIENIDGSLNRKIENPTLPLDLELPAGVYRAYMNLRSDAALSSTPKVDLFIE